MVNNNRPFNGDYYDSNGNIRNLMELGAPIGATEKDYMSPMSGNFYASDGSVHNIDELSGGSSGGDVDKVYVDAQDALVLNSATDLVNQETADRIVADDALLDNIETLTDKVNGITTGYVFNTEVDMDFALDNPSFVEALKIGDNLYIRDINAPDYWWDGEQARNLETEKVDLSNFYTKTEVANLDNAVSASANTYADEKVNAEAVTRTAADTALDNKKLNKTALINNLTQATPGVGALDAAQGKVLDEKKADRTLILSGIRNKCYKLGSFPAAAEGADRAENFIFEVFESSSYNTGAHSKILINKDGKILSKFNIVNEEYKGQQVYIVTYLNGLNVDVYLFSDIGCDFWRLHLTHMRAQVSLNIQDLGANTYVPPGTLISNSKTGEGCIGREYHNGKGVLTEGMDIIPDAANTRNAGSPTLPFKGVYSNAVQMGKYAQRYLGEITFNSGLPAEKFDILLPNVHTQGYIEVEITSGYSGGNASGVLIKRFDIISNAGATIESQQSYYTDASVNISNYFAISDLRYDSIKGKYITIAKRSPVANTVHVLIRFFGRLIPDVTQITLSSIYTTDTEVYPQPVVTLPISPAVGTNDLQPITAEFFQRELGAISKNIEPNVDNALNIGSASKRWKDFYLASGTISTSDKREKENIEDISEAYKNFFYSLRPVSFEFNEGIRTHLGLISQEVEAAMYDNGLNSLDFAGFINSPITVEVESDELEEREVEEEVTEEMEFEEEVIEEMEVEEEETYIDENGEEQVRINTIIKNVPVMKTVKRLMPIMKMVKKLVPKMKTVIIGERYGLRYEEFVPLLIKMTQLQQEQINRLEELIAKQEPTDMTDIESLPQTLGETEAEF